MSTSLEQTPVPGFEASQSAPPSADFSFGEDFETAAQQGVSELLFDSDEILVQGENVSAIFELRDHMQDLLGRYRERYDRNSAAADYSSYYHDELAGIEDQDLSHDQKSALVMAKLYLSALESLGQLGKFIATGRWTGRKSEDSEATKVVYLESRKKFQEDVDAYFDHFVDEPSEALYANLRDAVNMARLTISGHQFINAQTDDHTHVFLGSVLSERAVRVSLQENVHPEARYGTAEEDKSPTKADVVFPITGGDMHVQVKMKWTKATDFKVHPKKKPPHVIVPMQNIRANLTVDEHAKLAEIMSAAAEIKAYELQWEEAYALSGIKRYVAICRIPVTQYKAWWSEARAAIRAEESVPESSLQTEVNELELVA